MNTMKIGSMSFNMKKVVCYFICLLLVSACWVGLEYILEGAIHSSDVDGFVAIILSYFITDKFIGG
jgi:hypothetical protein